MSDSVSIPDVHSGYVNGQSTNHWNLQNSLVQEFRRRATNRPAFGMVFEEIAIDGYGGSKGRLDVVVATSSGAHRQVYIRGYEVKATRADLLRDLRADKWRKYLDRCTQFFFAYPKGLATDDEIPEEAGIMLWNGSNWYVKRKAPKLGDNPKRDTVMRLLWRMGHQEWERSWRVKNETRGLEMRVATLEAQLRDERQKRTMSPETPDTIEVNGDSHGDAGEEIR